MPQAAEEIYEILKEEFPIECDILGDSVVKDLSEGVPLSSFVDAGAGTMLDPSTVLSVVAGLVALLNALLKLREEHIARQKSRAEAELQQIRHQIEELLKSFPDLEPSQKQLAVKKVFPDIT